MKGRSLVSIILIWRPLTGDGFLISRSHAVNGIESKQSSFPLLKSSALEEIQQTESRTRSELPSVLQDIVDERHEFRLNLGRAMDVLKKDYPDILHKSLGTLVLKAMLLSQHERISHLITRL
jgi:hypothetical protein